MKADLLERLEKEIHVWLCMPDSINDPARLSGYLSLLSGEERERLQRFHFEKDRHAFLVSHALVRKVLSKYANIEPADWQFSTGEQGRPEIVRSAGMPLLRFNLTHTQGLAACVVTRDIACGIDAEKLTARGNPLAVAEKMFATVELADLNAQGEERFLERFYVYWTLHEAYCKALGVGLTRSDHRYAFVAGPGGQYGLKTSDAMQVGVNDWCFEVSRPTAEHVVSVAFQSVDCVEQRLVAEFTVP